MKILFVAPYPLSLIRVRSYGFVRQMMKSHEVHVLVLCSNLREVADVQALRDEGIAVTAIRERIDQKVLRVLRSLGSGLPLQVAFDASPLLRAALSAYVESENFDIVHIEFIRALGALPDILPVPVVWDAVDCISLLYEQGAKFGATPMLRLLGKGEARRTRLYERKQLERFQHVLVTSERDRQALLGLQTPRDDASNAGRRADITVLPHGVNQHYFQPYRGRRCQETLVFSGKMSFHANVAGILYFVEHTLPLIWKKKPGVQLIIAGSSPSSSIRQLARDARITVTGYVPDLRPYIAEARVSISPLPYAVGIQNKILEAMALGTPVVASSHAAAGLQTVAGHDLLVADEPEAFADAVLSLLDDNALWDACSQRGVTYIAREHDWEKIGERLLAVYTQAKGITKSEVLPLTLQRERG